MIGRAHTHFPDGTTKLVELWEHPDQGKPLVAQGVEEGRWIVTGARIADPHDDLIYEVWVTDA
jgi:hypothetical protein